ncbi:hypothetical protein BLA29_006222, partial [Euroglyphus maynei]
MDVKRASTTQQAASEAKNPLLDLSSMSLLANKIMANHHHHHHQHHHPHQNHHQDFNPFIANHHQHNPSHNSGVIQQTKTLTNIYNNVNGATNANDSIVNHGSQHCKCENTQLVQLLKPFYNSMQIHVDSKQQTP